VLRAYGDGNIFGEPYGQGPVRIVWLHGWRAEVRISLPPPVNWRGAASPRSPWTFRVSVRRQRPPSRAGLAGTPNW